LVLALACAAGRAQEPGLSLRHSDTLSERPGASPAQPEFDLSGPPLGLSLSRELIFVRPTAAVPSAEVNEVLFQVDVNSQGFNEYGVFTSSLLAPQLGSPRDWVRLDSTFAVDYPEKLTSLRLGDTLSRPGTWGRPIRLGGLQYGTNFNVQPGFIRQPVLEAAGSATLPSTVDLFVN